MRDKLCIAIILDFYDSFPSEREGIIVYLRKLCNAVLKYHQECYFELWCFKKNMSKCQTIFNDELASYGDRVTICTERSELSDQAYLTFQKDINQYSLADIAYIPFYNLKTGSGLKMPVVMQIHDLFTCQLEELFSEEYEKNYKEVNKKIIDNVDVYAKNGSYFFCSSNWTKEQQILKYVPNAKEDHVFVVRFLTLLPKFSLNNHFEKKEFINKYHIPERYIAFPSQIRPNKNVIVLLRAIEKLREQGVEISLVTTATEIGGCNTVKSTREFCKKHPGLVQEIGSLPENDLYYLYKYSSLVVCPNIIEGALISGQALEALEIGVPVIHGKSMGIEESLSSVDLNLESAPLRWFELGDYDTLADRIKEVLDDPERVVSEQASIASAYRKRTESVFSNDFIDSIKKIINTKSL